MVRYQRSNAKKIIMGKLVMMRPASLPFSTFNAQSKEKGISSALVTGLNFASVRVRSWPRKTNIISIVKLKMRENRYYENVY